MSEVIGAPVRKMAAVVIGRNEGERLAPSLRSVQGAGLPVVYVDSGSTDRSTNVARGLRVAVVELDASRPFSAARGRNEGLAEALRQWPATELIMFLDGDCTLEPAFPEAASNTFTAHPKCAIVTGHLTERHPEQSIYNRLCAIEWCSPAGPIVNMNGLGGIMAIRVAAFTAVGGFNEQAIAGEEPDLGVRLGLAGWTVLKIDQAMATHDAQMLRFSQWWKRAMRGGHAIAHRYARHGNTPFKDGRREVRSALFWGFALPLVVLLLLIPTRGLSLVLLIAGYAWLGWRVHRYYRAVGLNLSDASLATRFILYSKVPEFLGIVRYLFNRLRGQFHVIEYK